jgi:apolipoprotein N-acyltransferase
VNLLAAVTFLMFTGGRWPIALAAWLHPVFMLRFTRGGRALPRLLAAMAALYAVMCVAWWGMVPVAGPAYFAILFGIALPSIVPYAIDRVLVRRGAPFAHALVFPCAWALTEFGVSKLSPYGSWGAIAYTQVDQLALLQLASVAGLWGVAFVIAWCASVVNWSWEHAFEWTHVRRGGLACAVVVAGIVLAGGARLALAPPTAPAVRFASITVPWPPELAPGRLLRHARAGASLDSLQAALRAHQDALIGAATREAQAGAQVVAWSEVDAFVLAGEAQAFEARLARVARDRGITLIAGTALFTPGEGYYQNVLLAFGPGGDRLARYHKARPVPGDPERGADRAIPVFDTPVGRIAGAVCFDADFPDLIARAGRAGAGVLVVPSSDWRAIDPMHTRMALVRGIENGCAVVRQTNQGLSAAADHQGRILAATDFFTRSPCVMVAAVPARGARTLYPRMPAALPLLCAVTLLAFLVMAWGRSRRASHDATAGVRVEIEPRTSPPPGA